MAKKRRPTKADLEARRQMVENAARTRRLAERVAPSSRDMAAGSQCRGVKNSWPQAKRAGA